MVDYSSLDVIPIGEFEFAWRITDPKWSSLPQETLKRIKALSDARGKQIFEKSPLFGRRNLPFDAGRYHAIAQSSLEENGGPNGDRLKRWFRRLPNANDVECYLCWHVGEGIAAVTDWATFTEVWQDLWYPFDRLCVFDETLDWALLLGPEEYAVFIERGPVNPHLPSSDPAYGLPLVQTGCTQPGAIEC